MRRHAALAAALCMLHAAPALLAQAPASQPTSAPASSGDVSLSRAGDTSLRILNSPSKQKRPARSARPIKNHAPSTARAQLPGPAAISEAERPTALHRASEAYTQGEYRRAASLYQGLVRGGLENGYVYYNLGNCLVRTGQLGPGIAAYLRSARLLPRDQDIRANLQYARKSIKDAIAPPAPSALVQTLFFWHFNLSWGELLILAGAASALFWIGMFVRISRRESEILRWAVVGTLLVALVLAASLGVRAAWPREIAVVTRSETRVRSATTRKATVLFVLHEGAEAELLGREEGWIKLGLADGKRGWLRSDQVDVVKTR